MTTLPPPPAIDAAELRRLPPLDRDRILEAAALKAAVEYGTNVELTAFDAYGKDDLHGNSSSTRTR